MDDTLDEILARYEAASACGCCYDADFCAYFENKKASADTDRTDRLPDSAASRRGSMRDLFEHTFR